MTMTDMKQSSQGSNQGSHQGAGASGPVRFVFVDGASGTTGLGIQERLSHQPDITVRSIAEDKRKDPGAKRALMDAALGDAAQSSAAETPWRFTSSRS